MCCCGIKRKYNKRKRGTYMPVHDDLGKCVRSDIYRQFNK